MGIKLCNVVEVLWKPRMRQFFRSDWHFRKVAAKLSLHVYGLNFYRSHFKVQIFGYLARNGYQSGVPTYIRCNPEKSLLRVLLKIAALLARGRCITDIVCLVSKLVVRACVKLNYYAQHMVGTIYKFGSGVFRHTKKNKN